MFTGSHAIYKWGVCGHTIVWGSFAGGKTPLQFAQANCAPAVFVFARLFVARALCQPAPPISGAGNFPFHFWFGKNTTNEL
jgi:hypothetical protein